ncbi:hypothetical protein DV736_g1361, partial [Chaetothyriales sp. CBS 134916]
MDFMFSNSPSIHGEDDLNDNDAGSVGEDVEHGSNDEVIEIYAPASFQHNDGIDVDDSDAYIPDIPLRGRFMRDKHPNMSQGEAEAADLYHQNEDLRKQLQQAQSQSRKYHDQMTKAQFDAKQSLDDVARIQEEKRTLETSLECDRFILVLIDGDSLPFLENLVVRKVEGGLDAGRRLRNEIHDYIRTLPNYHADDGVVIHIFANIRRLAKICRQADIVRNEESVHDFVAGLSSSHALTSFTDTGGDKEDTNSKIRAELELFYRNHHCKHVILGGCDNGYAGLLQTFVPMSGTNERITILEGPLIPSHAQKVMKSFRVVQIRDVFRSAKIAVNTNGSSYAGLKRPAPEAVVQIHRRRRSLPPADEYDPTSPSLLLPSTGVGSSATQAQPSAPLPPPTPAVTSTAVHWNNTSVLYQNKYNQRLDSPLRYDKDFLGVLFNAKTKLCNNYYLKGHCSYGEHCSWDHSERLNALQLDTLRHKARTSACRDPFCLDAECTLGHMCPRGERCAITMCKYLPEMHTVDVTEVYEYNPVTQQRKRVHRED